MPMWLRPPQAQPGWSINHWAVVGFSTDLHKTELGQGQASSRHWPDKLISKFIREIKC
jgi:hypothetical protein